MQKRILFLGGSHYQVPLLIYAKSQRHYIITCDYLPNNPGHQYADEYYNISTTDQEALLELARRLRIDAVVAYASDPAAAPAAYVAEKLSLPGNPYESVRILSRKDLFRNFLRKHQFQAPFSESFTSLAEASAYMHSLNTPIIIKPVDSSGSKGVCKVTSIDQLPTAFNYALSFSRVKKVIIEKFIQRKGYQVAGDGFVVNGNLVFRCFAHEHFDPHGNPFAPIGQSFPLGLNESLQVKIHQEIERLMSLLDMKVGGLNFDIMLNENDDIYLMEIAGRNGGNLIPQVIKYSTGVDLVKNVVDGALGLDCSKLTMYEKADFYSGYTLHSKKDGLFKCVEISPSIQDNIVEKNIFVQEGMPVVAFKNSSDTLGCLIMKFNSSDEMLEKMESMSERVSVQVI